MTVTPKGAIVVLISPDGHVGAVGVDFDPGRPAGFILAEAQAMRAGRRAWLDLIDGMCSPVIAKAIDIDSLAASGIKRHVLNQQGWREHVSLIGHDTEATD